MSVRSFDSFEESRKYIRQLNGGYGGGRLDVPETKAKSGYFELKDSIKQSVTVNAVMDVNGIKTYGFVLVVPGKRYALGTDPTLLSTLKAFSIESKYSPELVEQLKASGIEYDEHVCKSCGGRVKKLSYSPLEIVEKTTPKKAGD